MTRKILFLLLAANLFAFGCTNQSNTNAKKGNSNAGEANVTKGVKPQADAEVAVVKTNYGEFTIEFYSNIAPKHVQRFKELAREGVYNGTSFHRINPGLGIIQGGDPLSKDADPTNDGTGKSDKPNLPAEFSDVPYERGIVGAARGADNDSANSQFFVMTKRQAAFDNRYTVFGKVIEGIGNVDLIAGAPTVGSTGEGKGQPTGSERPEDKITIESITFKNK